MAKGTSDWTRRETLRRGLAASGGIVLGGTQLAGSAAAKGPNGCRLNWGRELSARECDGDLVVNVTQRVVNDVDGGVNGYWAYANYRRLIRVWEVDEGTYCTTVKYVGEFDAVEGRPSPGEGGGDPLSGEEDGRLQGGYAATIEGTLEDDPPWPTRGFVGTTDYEGDVATGDVPGAVNWVSGVYFEDSTFSFDWWGWIYRGGRCGTWVNSIDGNCGDVRCD